MYIKISKRKLESYKRAEVIARELRYQLSAAHKEDQMKLYRLVINWMKTTGKIRFERPE